MFKIYLLSVIPPKVSWNKGRIPFRSGRSLHPPQSVVVAACGAVQCGRNTEWGRKNVDNLEACSRLQRGPRDGVLLRDALPERIRG
jgi:hypothetical protein